MRKFFLAAGVAALAIASPVQADKGGHGGGGGGGNGGGNGGGHGHGNDGGGGGGHGGGQAMDVGPGNGNGKGNGGGRGHGNDRAMERADRGHGGDTFRQFGDRGAMKHGNGHEQQVARVQMHGRDRGDERRDFAVRQDDGRGNRGQLLARNFDVGGRGFASACPPGLARKDNGCMPPGQAAKYLGARLQQGYANSALPDQYRSWYRDDGDHFYRSGDGYIYRVDRSNDLVDGIIPLFGDGGYYAVGDAWPSSYDFYNVPYQYRDYYADTGQYDYRYGDGAIYRIDSGSGVIDGIVALLAGDLGVAQRLPVGYETYNVPFQYRDRYADTADNWYRYNDGYIYQVDPRTRLISAVIDAIT